MEAHSFPNRYPSEQGWCSTLSGWTRLMFNLVRMGKEWAGPVFHHPISHMHKVFPHQITFCTRLMFYLVRVGKEWAGPVFPHPLRNKGYLPIHDRVSKVGCVFQQTINHMHNSFPPPDNLLKKVDILPCQAGERMGWPSFSPPQD